jgi:hypothetical protein
MAGDADGAGRRAGVDHPGDRGVVGREGAVGGGEARKPRSRLRARVGFGPQHGRARVAGAAEEDLDPRRARRRRGPECAGAVLPSQRGEHALDMLAGAEPVDAMVDAAAGIAGAFEVADLNVVDAARGRAHAERPIYRKGRLQRLDIGDLGAAAPASELDLVVVAGPPAEGLRLGERLAGTGLLCCCHDTGGLA